MCVAWLLGEEHIPIASLEKSIVFHGPIPNSQQE
jgi:hypothetical protein